MADKKPKKPTRKLIEVRAAPGTPSSEKGGSETGPGSGRARHASVEEEVGQGLIAKGDNTSGREKDESTTAICKAWYLQAVSLFRSPCGLRRCGL